MLISFKKPENPNRYNISFSTFQLSRFYDYQRQIIYIPYLLFFLISSFPNFLYM